MRLLLVLLISFSALAEDNVRDLMFFPDQGTLWAQTSYSSAEQSYEINNKKTKTTTVQLTQSVSYIPARDIALIVSATYIPSYKLKSSGDTYKSEGTTNPTFSFVKRIHTQKENGHALFIKALYSPDIIEAKDSSTTKEGNVARGGAMSALSIIAGKKVDENQHRFSLSLKLYGKTEEEPASGSGKNESDPTNTLTASYNFQTDINSQFSIIAGFEWNKFSATETLSSDNSKLETDGYTQIGYGFGGKYIISNSFVLNAVYESVVKTDVDGTSNGTDFTFDDLDSNSFTIGAIYKF